MSKKTEAQEEEYYEVVPTRSYTEEEKKSEDLEKEIQEIKDAIKGTGEISEFGESAEKFMSKILELLKNSQRMVKEVSKTNKELSSKIQTALDSMNKTNEILSNKLTKILDYFAEAAEVEGAESEEIGTTITKQMNGVRSALQAIIKQNKQTQELLKRIEKNIRTQSKQMKRASEERKSREVQKPTRTAPQQQTGGPQGPSRTSQQRAPPSFTQAPESGERGGEKPETEEGELPPPPFPPSEK